jgi:flagellin
MAINIRTNVESINAQRHLNATSQRLSQAYSRLSSGLRITRAADDAAGLAIADQLRADVRIATVAIRNASDGISIIAITDGAMDEISNVLTRMAELAEQSANGVFSNDQRLALQGEFDALGSEIQRIAATTEFNGLKLLSGTGEITFQVGFDGSTQSQISFNGAQATLMSLGLASVDGSQLAVSITVPGSSSISDAQAAARNALDTVRASIGSLTRSRGSLGAAESRLNVTVNALQIARENFQSAESRIRDVDVASEAAELTRLSVLQQAAAAVLAQANQQPGLALSLIQ